jgi:hypothetical protein
VRGSRTRPKVVADHQFRQMQRAKCGNELWWSALVHDASDDTAEGRLATRQQPGAANFAGGDGAI